jgi:hypothetical protein
MDQLAESLLFGGIYKIVCFVMSVCPSLHMEQLGFYWAEYNEI